MDRKNVTQNSIKSEKSIKISLHFWWTYRVVGNLEYDKPVYIFRDPELIKKIGVKDFEYFEDHRILNDENPLIANSLISLKGEKWRNMRGTLTPTFTGSKMRQMFELISEYTDDMVKFLSIKSKSVNLDFEMSEFFARYSNDVIATCAFGLRINSFADPNNEFYAKAKDIFGLASNTGLWRAIKAILFATLPMLAKVLRLNRNAQKYSNEFKSMILKTMAMRKEKKIYRPDMINTLMQVQEKELHSTDRVWSEEDLVAQCFLFFVAGFSTSSFTLTFAAYEILANPDVQQKLYEEIVETNGNIDGRRISYDELQKMKYLDQVMSETLRKWPLCVVIDRICVKDYNLDDGKNLKFKIEKGRYIQFPTFGLHYDEKYFPEPERFNPDRFNDENKNNIVQGTYLPFGIGPRNCIGERIFLL